MRTYVAVPGTWGWRDRDKPESWFLSTSPFARELELRGIRPLRQDPFLWTTRINGADWWRRAFSRLIPKSWEHGDLLDWHAAAEALRWYCEAECTPDIVIAHSHAGQVAALAAAAGLKIPLLITVCTPVREDMQSIYRLARGNVGYWRHLFSEDGDPYQWWGSFGDGDFCPSRTMLWSHENHGVPQASHTKLLKDPRLIQTWAAAGWLNVPEL